MIVHHNKISAKHCHALIVFCLYFFTFFVIIFCICLQAVFMYNIYSLHFNIHI